MEQNERIQVRVDEAGMEAWVTLLEGPAFSIEDFRAHLAAMDLSAGISERVLETIAHAIAQESAMTTEVSIARGRPPEPPTPPTLVLNDPAGPVAGVLLPDGRLDLRERLLIVPVEESQQIGQVQPGKQGKDGQDIFGEPVPAAPLEEISINHGDGIVIDEAGHLISTQTGARTISPDGKIDVVDHHIHPGSVDLASGNLKTRGSLEVARDVTTGMTVWATADVKIGGMIDGGRVYAGASLEIKGGAIGCDSGAVHAEGDLSVRHALGIRIQCGGRLTVARSVSTSHLIANEIDIQGKILSDCAQAETRIIVQEAGSKAGGPCILRAAYPMSLTSTNSETSKEEKTQARKGKAVTSLRDRKGRGSRSVSRATSKGATRKGRTEKPRTQKQLDLEARRKWRNRQRELQKTAVIEVIGVARAGCRIDFGVAPLILEESVGARRFRVDPKSQKIIVESME